MKIRCGNHGHPVNDEIVYHDSLADVRACFAGAVGGEQTYGDVILTTSELAKVADGIRDLEIEGILPRSSRQARPISGTTPTEQAAKVAKWDAEQPTEATPKGRQMPKSFGGSVKQYDFVMDLNTELDGHFTQDAIDNMIRRDVSYRIDQLKTLVQQRRQMARVAAAAKPAPTAVKQTVTNSEAKVVQDGIYRNRQTGELFKVQYAVHGSGNLYAKQAYLSTVDGDLTEIPLDGDTRPEDRIEWAYRPGLINKIQPEWRVTKEEAAAFGALYGRCIRCHRTLTLEESIERAMGSTCAGKMGW